MFVTASAANPPIGAPVWSPLESWTRTSPVAEAEIVPELISSASPPLSSMLAAVPLAPATRVTVPDSDRVREPLSSLMLPSVTNARFVDRLV